MLMRNVCFFTGTRAEYGLLRSVMAHVRQRGNVRMSVIVSGMHLDDRYGHTVDEIVADGMPVDARVEVLAGGTTEISVCTAMGLGMIRYADTLARLSPDVVVLLGDRFEAFAMAAAATVCRIPLAHIHGGEATEGLIDEPFRHSITKMSHLHFTSCEAYRRRVVQLGEHPDRVFNVGSLGVEAVQSLALPDEHALRAELDLGESPFFLCTYHPVTLEDDNETVQMDAIFTALDRFPEHLVVFTGANADPCGARVNAMLRERGARDSRYRFHLSLGQKRYLAAARAAACVIGNSSSGIIEVPSLGTPVLDIGDRQRGRVRSASVLHCVPEADAIASALAVALSSGHSALVAEAVNPHDLPGTSEAIASVLEGFPLDGILKKGFFDV